MSGKKISTVIVVLILIVAGFLWYRGWKTKQNQPATAVPAKSSSVPADSSVANSDSTSADSQTPDQVDQAEQDFNVKCESGEWTKIADVSGSVVTMTGKLRKVSDVEDPQEFKNYAYFLDGTDKAAITGKNLNNLDMFEDRDTEVQGVVKEGAVKELAVSQIRCAGAETDKNVISERNKLLSWLQANINSIAPKKAPYQKWTIDTVDFVDGKNVYVEYYDTAEDDENFTVPDNVDTARKILVEVSANSNGNYDVRNLAYWEMGDEDYVLKTGTDKFENVTDLISFQYDPDAKSWTRI